jgi:hypothetical protein
MKFGESTRVPDCKCLRCGHPLNSAFAPFPLDADVKPKPKPGDITLCIHCAHVMVFDPLLMLREPTTGELMEIAHDSDVDVASAAIAQLNRQRKEK